VKVTTVIPGFVNLMLGPVEPQKQTDIEDVLEPFGGWDLMPLAQ